MIRKVLGACGAAVVVAAAWACSSSDETPRPAVNDGARIGDPIPDAGPPLPDAGTPSEDAGTPPADAGTPPDGTDGGSTDAGTGGGTDGGTGAQKEDPWPKEPAVNYSQRFGVGNPQGVAVDDAFNIWLLDGDRIGVLRPGDSKPVWASNIGQAGRGFSSTVICGGSAGRAYVGYYARELDEPMRSSYQDASFTEGDLDAVKLTPEGTIVLEEHVNHSYRRDHEKNDGSIGWNPPTNIGIRNSNDWRFDEDRSVLSCVKVMRGRDKGEVYIGTNHGVTRIRGLDYNSHRHPVWFDDKGGQHIGYSYGLGIAQDGDVLIANDWTFGIVTPNADLGLWDAMVPKELNPMKVESSYLPEVNSIADFDHWRGFQQTKDGRYYLASKDHGLWEMSIISRGDRAQRGTKVSGLPTGALTSLAATDDGSLFIGTAGSGLWRMDKDKKLSKVANVPGRSVRQLVYDPNASPAMLYVLTDAGLTVLRGN